VQDWPGQFKSGENTHIVSFWAQARLNLAIPGLARAEVQQAGCVQTPVTFAPHTWMVEVSQSSEELSSDSSVTKATARPAEQCRFVAEAFHCSVLCCTSAVPQRLLTCLLRLARFKACVDTQSAEEFVVLSVISTRSLQGLGAAASPAWLNIPDRCSNTTNNE
jgi:hypothetical protein